MMIAYLLLFAEKCMKEQKEREQDIEDNSSADSEREMDMDIEEEDDEILAEHKVEEKATTKKNLYSIPTAQEQSDFKQSELFKSSLFKLKIDEMIQEIKISYSTKTILNVRKVLFSLKNFICDEMDTKIDMIGNNEHNDDHFFTVKQVLQIQEKHQIQIPLMNRLNENSLLKFKFIKTGNLFVVGSFILELLLKKQDKKSQNVDLVFEMPEDCFQEKDHMNNRYFYKRSFYLSMLALKLREKFGQLFNYEFEYFQNDLLRPILVLHSTEENPMHFSRKGYCIRLIPQMPSSIFSLSKLSPRRNNIRPFKGNQDSSTSSAPLPPTPLYNSSIIQDLNMSKYTDSVHEALKISEGMRDAILLFKVWIEQRRFSGDRVGYEFNGFLVSMIMVWLMTVKVITSINISRQRKERGSTKALAHFKSLKLQWTLLVFQIRPTNTLANHNFDKSPLFLTETSTAIDNLEFSAQVYLDNFEVAIVDQTGTLNLAAAITKTAIQEVQYEAKLALSFLQDQNSDRFDDVFLKNVHQEWIKYDNVFRIPFLSTFTSPFVAQFPNLSSKVGHEIGFSQTASPRLAISNLFSILSKGMTDRCRCIAVWTASHQAWSIDCPSLAEQDSVDQVVIGMVLDPESSLRQVEFGPLSNDMDAVKEFTSLWGDRSEMRRFQDGSIRECVVFECDSSLAQKSVLVARMTAFLLSRHFQVGESHGVVYWAGIGGKFISLPSTTVSGKVKQDVVKSFTPVMNALQDITREIKSLDLPLSIHRVHHCSDSLSYCSVFIPQPVEEHDFAPRCNHPEFLIEFENSGKWPDDVGAIETMKRAFYIQIASLLEESETQAVVMVQDGADAEMDSEDENYCAEQQSVANESFLQITHSTGYTFNVRIHHPRVGVLLERAVKGAGTDFKTKAPLQAFQKSYIRRFVATPVHYHMISNLCLRFTFLGTTIRLTKRWLAAHLLLGPTCIAGEVVDLICARVYTTPTAFGTPSSGWTGFVRVLDLIKSWRWNVEPLIVELQLEGAMAISVQDDINTQFAKAALARGGNAPILFVATETDTSSTSFGSTNVSTKIVQRLCTLATQSLHVIQNQLLTGNNNDVSQLFLTPFDGYDAVIHLDSTQIARYFESVQFDPKKAPKRTSRYKNLMDAHDRQFLEHSRIDLVQLYLQDLTLYFGELAMFFADFYGGSKIALVWMRPHLEPGPFKINLGYLASVSSDGKTMSPNKMAILSEFQRLGGSLVQSISSKQ